MTKVAQTPSELTDDSEGMSYLASIPRRIVTLYTPLLLIVIVLLFPFYWMVITAIKPKEHLLDLDSHNPFWTWQPTLEHINALLFETEYPHWLWNTMFVAVVATVLSLIASVLAAYAITRIRFRGAEAVGGRSSWPTWCRPRSCSFRCPPWSISTACSTPRSR